MILQQSPLFEPVLWDGDHFKILDELLVPERIEYIHISEVGQALVAVREMKTRAFGQVLTFLYSGALLALGYSGNEPAPLREQIAQMTEDFCAARPTFDFRGLGAFFEGWFGKLSHGRALGEIIAAQAREFAGQIVCARRARAARLAAILPNQAHVLTHCNISGELVEIARHCRKLGKEIVVIATETRPYLQGTRLTAWELAEAGISVSLIPDCAITQVMAGGEVNAVIVGADRAAQNGDIINKVGTYPLALMAREYGIPFHALVQEPRSLQRGRDVPIEERPAAELLMFRGEPITVIGDANLTVRYPSFDITPAALVTHLIGFDDVYTPERFRLIYGGTASIDREKAKEDGKYVLIYGVPPKTQSAFLLSALKAEKAERLLVAEMRPELWGAQFVAPALLEQCAPVTLISDNIMGTLFAQGEIAKLCLFYDALSTEGPVGICGSLLAVQLARLHRVGIELFSADPTKAPARDRNVSSFMGKKLCPTGVTVRPVTAEVIPWALLRE